MILASAFHIYVLPMLWLIVVWILTMQILTIILAQLPGNALIAWCVNLLGISALYLHKPNTVVRGLRLVVPILGAAVVTAVVLRAPNPLPLTIVGEMDPTILRIEIIAGLTLALSLPRLLGAVRGLRAPLWGEVRLLDRAAHASNLLIFTSAGRTYLRERFGVSPEEFLRVVRRRTPLATGAPL